MNHYKYIHLLWGHDAKFTGPLVNMINSSPDFFEPDEHLFITPYDSVLAMLPSFSNVILDNNGTQAEIINKYADLCDWILSHGLINDPYKIKRKYLNKIVWRTWGGSRQKTIWDKQRPFHSLVGKCCDLFYYLYYRFSYGCSPVIGIANTVDALDLEQWNWHNNAAIFHMGYPDPNSDGYVEDCRHNMANKDTLCRILVGHQGEPGENHLEIIRKLLLYNDNNMEIVLPLSYGDEKYIISLKQRLKELADKRICVLEKFLPKADYIKLLSQIDIAILDEKNSMALGNIALLLYFKKIIVLNKDGIIRKAFDHEGLPYLLSEGLGNFSFAELSKPLPYPIESDSDLFYQPYSRRRQRYLELFHYLDLLMENGKHKEIC